MMKDVKSRKLFLTINNPPPPSVSPQEITAQNGIGIGNAIGNISLNNNLAQLSWSSRFITVLTS